MLADNPAVVAPYILAHGSAKFEFVVDAPLDRAAPFFGPEGERSWTKREEWDPHFLYPSMPKDQQGAVFTIVRGGQYSVWVNTLFDLTNGRMQYVVFVPGLMTTTIDVNLRPDGAKTQATVTYTRTALSPEANPTVMELSRKDASQASEWSDAIAGMLRTQPIR